VELTAGNRPARVGIAQRICVFREEIALDSVAALKWVPWQVHSASSVMAGSIPAPNKGVIRTLDGRD